MAGLVRPAVTLPVEIFSAAKSDGAVRALLRLLLDGGHECQVGAWVVAAARRMDAGRTVGALLQSARSSSLQTTMMRTIGALEAVNKPGALPGPVGQAAVAAARALDLIAPGA